MLLDEVHLSCYGLPPEAVWSKNSISLKTRDIVRLVSKAADKGRP